MTINYMHTRNIIPKVISGNKELFLNEIMDSKEKIKTFLEKDTYLKTCDKLNLEAVKDFTIEEIDEVKHEFGRLVYIKFFDNYLIDDNDTKSIVLVTYKGELKYYVLQNDDNLYEIDVDNLNEYLVANLGESLKDRIIKYVLDLVNKGTLKVSVGISNHHVHLCQEDFEILFGKGAKLEFDFALSQKGQFASKQRVTIKNKYGEFENLRILGPIRKYTQVEISRTDSYKLKINPPVRDSGDLNNSEKITIVGPKGEVSKNEGCIIANRHIHLTDNDLAEYGLDKNRIYKVRFKGEKGGILDNVHLKVDDSFTFELHLDTDDANAFLIKNGDQVEIIK